MLAVAVWGGYLAAGAYLANRNPIPPLIVVGCFAGFLGLWLALLSLKRRRDSDDP